MIFLLIQFMNQTANACCCCSHDETEEVHPQLVNGWRTLKNPDTDRLIPGCVSSCLGTKTWEDRVTFNGETMSRREARDAWSTTESIASYLAKELDEQLMEQKKDKISESNGIKLPPYLVRYIGITTELTAKLANRTWSGPSQYFAILVHEGAITELTSKLAYGIWSDNCTKRRNEEHEREMERIKRRAPPTGYRAPPSPSYRVYIKAPHDADRYRVPHSNIGKYIELH